MDTELKQGEDVEHPVDRAPSGDGRVGPFVRYPHVLGLVHKPFPGLWGFAGLLALAVLAQIVLAGGLFSLLSRKSALSVGLVAVAASLLWILVGYGAVRLKGLEPLRAFRAFRPRLRHPYWFVALSLVLGALIVLPSGFLYELVAQHLSHGSQDVLDMVGKARPTAGAAGVLILAVAVVAPLGEELFFRGLSFSGMKENYGFFPAAFAVSVMFAVIHFDPAKMLSIFFLSLVLCALVDMSGSVWPAVAAHVGYNGVQVVAWVWAWMERSLDSGATRRLSWWPALVSLVLALGLFYHLRRMQGESGGETAGPIVS